METRRLSETLELEVQVVVSHSIRLLGTKLFKGRKVLSYLFSPLPSFYVVLQSNPRAFIYWTGTLPIKLYPPLTIPVIKVESRAFCMLGKCFTA